MITKFNNLTSSILRQSVSWFAILPIVLLQLIIAFHQFEHDASYSEKNCDVCIQLDRIDSAIDQSPEALLIPSVGSSGLNTPPILATLAPIRNFDSRAPPQI
ncbi:MAG: hypothetical protein P8J74_01355 [Woeseiaceae bacterium]|nr:hypothetical protein [Woeseiaceae bacterium]